LAIGYRPLAIHVGYASSMKISRPANAVAQEQLAKEVRNQIISRKPCSFHVSRPISEVEVMPEDRQRQPAFAAARAQKNQ
jgi:hypothetical protein